MSCRLMCVAAAVLLIAFPAAAQPFTYQGSLEVSGAPANGLFDIEYRAFSALTGGVQVGMTQTAAGVSVADGLFANTIDFGSSVFSGADRFVEIRTRPSGVGASFTTLTPRQRITATPYAIHSLGERWIDQGNGSLVNDSARVGSVYINRTTPVTGADYLTLRTPTGDGQFGGMYVETASATGLPFYGYARNNFVRAYTYIDALGNWALFMNGNRLVVTNTGQVGINKTPTGPETLQVSGDVDIDGDASAADYAYAAPRERIFTLGAEDFRPIVTTTPGTFGQGPGFIAQLDSSVAFGEIVAPLHLPAGALITAAHFYCQAGTNNTLGAILRRNINTLSEDIMASSTTAGQAGVFAAATLTGFNAPIDPSSAVYRVRVSNNDWTSGAWVRYVKVFYTVPAPD